MLHPFSWLPSRFRWVVLALLIVGSIVFMAKLWEQGKPLKTDAAPAGVLSYEFAWSRARAGRMIESWAGLREAARDQLIVDFGFLVFYPLAISLSCAMMAEKGAGAMATAGRVLSWAVLVAAPLDAIENLALLHMLGQGPTDLVARSAALSAGLKFALALVGLGYLFAGLGFLGVRGLLTFARRMR